MGLIWDSVAHRAKRFTAAEREALQGVIESGLACPERHEVVRTRTEGADRRSDAIDALVAGGWLVAWAVRGHDAVTLTPRAARRLLVALIYPEREGPKVEPRWGRSGNPKVQEREHRGRYLDEPRRFRAERDWGRLKREVGPFAYLADLRAMKAKPEPELVMDPATERPMTLFAGDGGKGITVTRDRRIKPPKGTARKRRKAG